MAFRFQVADVSRDPRALPEVRLEEVWRARGVPTPEAGGSNATGRLVACDANHGLVMAAHLAYAHHRPLILSPDDVWLCVAQGVGQHLQLHAEALRGRLVRHGGQVELEVRRDDFLPGSPDNDWLAVVESFSAQLAEHLGGRRDLFECGFSTTGRIERCASTVALMGAVRRYFSFGVSTLCGIPEIALEGGPEDWRAILDRIPSLRGLEMDAWLDTLEPILAHFVEAASGRVDLGFWSRLYKLEGASGGDRVTGWIAALFPYLTDSPDEEDVNPAVSAEAPGTAPEDRPFVLDMPRLTDLPSGLARAPFTWRLLGGERPMQLVAGHVGVCEEADGALRAVIGWAVTEGQPDRRFLVSQGSVQGLHRVSPRRGAELVDLVGAAAELRDLREVQLSLGWCEALTSLAGAAEIAGLRDLSVIEAPALRTLDGLRGAVALESLSITQCAALEDIEGLTGLPELRVVNLSRCPSLRDVRALATLPLLENVHLFHCPAVPEELRRSFRGREEVRSLVAALRS